MRETFVAARTDYRMIDFTVDNYATEGQCILAPWYCAQTYVGREQSLNSALLYLGIETYLPIIPIVRYRNVSRYNPIKRAYEPNREKVDASVPLFPGYLFARLNDGAWAAAKTRLGVRYRPRWVSHDGAPIEVGQDCIDYAASLVSAPRAKVNAAYCPGDNLEVISGPFAGRTGICSYTADERVYILLSMLGRQPLISFAQHEVQPLTFSWEQ